MTDRAWRECSLMDAMAWASGRTVAGDTDGPPPPPGMVGRSPWPYGAFDGSSCGFTDGSAISVASTFAAGFGGSELTPADDPSAEPPRFWIGVPR